MESNIFYSQVKKIPQNNSSELKGKVNIHKQFRKLPQAMQDKIKKQILQKVNKTKEHKLDQVIKGNLNKQQIIYLLKNEKLNPSQIKFLNDKLVTVRQKQQAEKLSQHTEKSEKYNPDVLKKYSKLEKYRKNQRISHLNKPYKLIITDGNKINKPIKSINDLKIKIENHVDKEIIDQKLGAEQTNRTDQDIHNREVFSSDNKKEHEKQFNIRNREIFQMKNYKSETHEDLKTENEDYYKTQASENSGQKIDNIIKSLKDK